MVRAISRIFIAVAVLCVIGVVIQFQVRPRLLLGEQVTLHFSKSVFISCLSNPVEEVRIREVGLSGVRVEAVTSRLEEGFAMPEWAVGCADLGITASLKGSKGYFIPFSVIGTVQRQGVRIWSNPLAT